MKIEKITRLPDVIQRIGLCRSWIYSAMSRGEFPKPLSLGARAIGWLESDIDAFIESRVAISRGGSKGEIHHE